MAFGWALPERGFQSAMAQLYAAFLRLLQSLFTVPNIERIMP